MPFLGAHFGTSHAWSFDWMAKDHLPTAPSISKLPTVSGSGVGVVHHTHTHFPEKYQNSFIIGDWTNKCIITSQPLGRFTDGAEDAFETLADAGRTQAEILDTSQRKVSHYLANRYRGCPLGCTVRCRLGSPLWLRVCKLWRCRQPGEKELRTSLPHFP